MRNRIVVMAVAALALGSLAAHDMWLEAESFVIETAGREILIRNGNGTIYQKSENAVSVDRIAQLLAVGPSGDRLEVPTPKEEGAWLDVRFTPEQAGNYWVGLATKPRMIRLEAADFNDYLRHDGIPNVLKEREEKGISGRDEVERYSKFVKAYLQVGSKNSRNYKRPLGLAIEIVPQKNPYSVQVGGDLPIQVLFRGRPLAGLTLHAGYAGQPEESTHVVTDRAGKARVRIGAVGRWYVRGIHLFQVDLDDHSYESYWTTLTFEVSG